MKQLLAQIISACCPWIRGKRTHYHAVVAGIIFLVLAYIAIQQGNIFAALVMIAMALLACAIGCMRWTMKAIEKKVDALMEKAGTRIYRD